MMERVLPVVLEGSHVRLEPLEERHIPGLCEVGLDPGLWQWTANRVRNADELEAYVRAALAERQRGVSVPFATLERASGRVVGSTRYGNIDMGNRRVEIGWTWVAPQWQRTAINTEAKYLMLRHGFEALGCLRIEFKTDLLNEKSRAALARLGAVEEGVLRSHMITQGGRVRDTVYFSILAAEWPTVRTRLEARLGRAAGALEPPVA